MTLTTDTSRHSLPTRLFHAALAIAVLVQLGSSQVMHAPRPNRPGNWAFFVHEYSGLAAMVLVIGFWLLVLLRLRGTHRGLLMPWGAAARRGAVLDDARRQWGALRQMRLPPHDPDSPLASAVHGLGLLLMTGMAGTGLIYYLLAGSGLVVEGAMALHEVLANLVWAYLVGHAGLALIHHFARQMNLREMWSFRGGTGQ